MIIDDRKAKKTLLHLWSHDWFLGLLLAVVTFAAYQPVWNGSPIWDDEHHLTKPELRSMEGLARIWTQLGATPQYYPLVHSVFWLEYHLWGNSTPGYHFLNILLHVFSAILLVCILRRLAIPGAWFVAAIFALHPIQVESVAWITELKNTLSGVFFLSAALAYLKFDRERKRRLYAIAFGLFILGLLSKSVIATLPVSLLVVFWWKRGKLQWKQDAFPLLPFFVVGIASGLFTAWVERTFIGAEGSSFTFTIIERCLIAGRAFWFYLSKLFWPAHLTFIYPRWNVSQATWWLYLFPIATLILAGVLWALRNRWRAPLAVFIYFTATLFPALGFFNVYSFRYSFVADHFQYSALIGPITLTVAGMNWGLGYCKKIGQWFLRPTLYGMLLLTLGVLTWKQSGMYADAEILYRTTIRKNSDCWMAHNNLGIYLVETGHIDEAMSHFRKALEINPNLGEAYDNLGLALFKTGRTDEAISHYRKALEINPNNAEAHYNLGLALLQTGRTDEAISHYQKALEINPNLAEVQNNLGNILLQTGRMDEAVVHFRKALDINPNYAQAHNNLGDILLQTGRMDEAIVHFRKALEINPNNAKAHYNLGIALFQTGQTDEAISHYRKALETNPNDIALLNNLAAAFLQKGQRTDAIQLLQRALKLAKSTGEETQAKAIAGNIEKAQSD